MSITIIPSKQFTKNYKKRINKQTLKKRFKERVKIFKTNRSNKVIRDHKLKGKMEGVKAFSITGDIRVIYKEIDKTIVQFLDVGAHNQVYGE